MSDFDIRYVAKLARIALSPEEEKVLGSQLSQILGYVEQLKEVNVEGIEPTAHAIPLTNVMRPDVVEPSLGLDQALANAPASSAGLFLVPKIVE